eukprot:GHVT01079556.1.p1 GENE.GHVT01079556.1~~GHVT01079556.1.p1  ORF type:complete len:131 (+),score=20.76 GHVT01079556.1:646-1038(+)
MGRRCGQWLGPLAWRRGGSSKRGFFLSAFAASVLLPVLLSAGSLAVKAAGHCRGWQASSYERFGVAQLEASRCGPRPLDRQPTEGNAMASVQRETRKQSETPRVQKVAPPPLQLLPRENTAARRRIGLSK